MHSAVFDAICLLCGFQTGRVVGNRYQASRECAPISGPIDPRRLRCCRCGGSVYLEAAEQPTASALVWDEKHRAIV